MNHLIIVLLISAVSTAQPVPYGLHEDLQDFVNLLPKSDILNIVLEYMSEDEEVQDAFNYIMSDDFKQLVLDIEAIPEYRKFLSYLQDNGVNVYYYINQLHDFLGLPEFVPKSRKRVPRRGVGVRGMLDDIEAILPVSQIEEMYNDKMQNSPAFQNLIDTMRGDEFKKVVEQLKANKRFQDLMEKAQEHGVNIELIKEILEKIFGWS